MGKTCCIRYEILNCTHYKSITLLEKCPNTEFFLDGFEHFSHSVILRIFRNIFFSGDSSNLPHLTSKA